MRNYFIFIIVCVSLLALTSSAWAVIELKYEGWEMTVEGRISQEYTDNLTFAGEDERVEKFMTSLSLMFDVNYSGKRRTYDFTGNISRWFDNDDFDSLRGAENASVGFSHQFSEYSFISLSDSFHHSTFPVDFEEEFGRFRGDWETYNNIFNVGYSRDMSEHIQVVANYSNSIYWAEGFEGDSVGNSVGLRLNYIYSVATSGSLSYNYLTRRYEDDGTATVNSISIGLKKYITQRLYLDGNAGFALVSPVEGGTSTTATYSLTLTDEIDERTMGRVSFRRSVNTTIEGDVFVNWQTSASLERDLMENLKGSLSGFYGVGEYELAGVRDTFIGASGRINYIFGKHLTGNIGYRYSNLDSTDNRGYTVNSISAGLTLTF